MRENKPSIFRILVTFVTIYSFLFVTTPARAYISPISNAQLYSFASQGNVPALRAAVQRGLNIDSLDRNGNTALCHAVIQRNYTAYNTLRAAGANPSHPCMQKIIAQNRESFLSSKRVVPATANSRQAYAYLGEEEFVFSTSTWVVTGILLAGAALAIALALDDGGGDDNLQYYETTEYNLAGVVGSNVPNTPESLPYSSIYLLAQSGNTVVNGTYPDYNLGGTNQNGWVISNNSSVNADDGSGNMVSTPLIDLIDFNTSVLTYTDYIQTAMKAINGSTVNNGYAVDDPLYTSDKDYLITLQNNTTALAAYKNSFANNFSRINIDATNGTIAMIGSINSVVTNLLQGQINMVFRGTESNHSVIGMYADTSSTALNQGTIYGQVFSSGSANGTLVGMRGQILNQENPVSSRTYVKNDGTITLEASALNNNVSTSLIGMGSWLEDDFLNGTMYLSRAGNVYLENLGSVILNMSLSGESGTYGSTADGEKTALLQGNGGIVGMKSDGNTTASNSGLIQINVNADDQNTVTSNHAGMLSVHGGNIINNNTIEINGGEGGYGMLSVRGEGSSSEFDSVTPSLINNGSITVDSEGGFGMAAYNGNAVTNNGTIQMEQNGTGILLQNGTITNSGTVSMKEGGTAISLTGKGTVNNTASAVITVDATASVSSDSSGGDTSGDGENTGSFVENIGIFAQNGAVNNDGAISVLNSGNYSDVTAYAIKTASANVQNTARISMLDIADAFGIAVENGFIQNSGNIFIGSSSGAVYNSAYGLLSTTGNIQNSAQITINSINEAYAISSASGNVVNSAVIDINQNTSNQTDLAYGIQAQNGAIQNTADINIKNANESYALSSTNGDLTNSGAITISNPYGSSNGTAYALQVLGKGEITNSVTADIIIDGFDSSYAISSVSGNVTNDAEININQNTSNQTDLAYAIQAQNGAIQNTADINIKNAKETYALSSTNGNLTNSGAITISNPDNSSNTTAYALQVLGKGEITNTDTADIIIDGFGSSYAISSVSGNVTNNAEIYINQNTSNQTDLAYGIQAQNGAIQNTANISINNVNQSYGLASTNGNVTNSGQISLASPNTSLSDTAYGIQVTGNGDITNSDTATISINNSNAAYGLSAANGDISSNATITINGNTGSSSALAYGIQGGTGNVASNGEITINNANEGYGINVQNGEVINNADISLTNSQQSQNKTSYGIYATTGSVTNNADITMNVTGDLSSGISVDTGSFGIWADQANIVNSQNSSITFLKRGNGMYSASGSSDNYGTISLEDGGIAMSSESGDITNHEGATITIVDTGVGLQSGLGSAVNSGSITITGDDSTGISSQNYAENNNSVVINGDNATGMIATADNAKIINNANITLNTVEASISNYGMRGADGAFTRLENAQNATISINAQNEYASTENYAYALYFDTGEATNSGDIIANNIYTYGMYFANGGTIENSGNIQLNYGGVGLYGSASSASETETASLTNQQTGIIEISGDYPSYGMQASGITTAWNDGEITISAASSYGIYTDTGSGTNANTITMDSADSVGMFSASADLINKDTATITINGTGSVGMLSNNSGNTDESQRGVVNNGEIILSSTSNGSIGIEIDAEGKGTNNNIIKVESAGSSGVLAAGDSSITNSNTGTITVSGNGAYGMKAEGDGTATNDGTITVTEDDSYALYAYDDGTIINNAGAVITTQGSSVLWVNNAHAENYADITNSNDNFTAIRAQVGGSVLNEGDISLSGTGASAIYIDSGATVTAQNSGTLELTANNSTGAYVGGGTFTNAAGGAINVGTGTASVQNSYGINAESATISNNGSINVYTSSGAGISSSGDSEITNAGTVTVTGDNNIGINTLSGSITNNAGNSVTVSGANAIGLNSSSATITNSGILDVSGSSSFGIKSTSGSVTNEITANIYADGNNAVGIYSGTNEIANSGNVYVGSEGGSSNVVGLQTQNSEITNDGYVYAEGANAIGALATNGGSITNNNNIQVEGSNAVGMQVSGSGGSITNAQNGTISAVGSGAIGMSAQGAATATNVGTILVSGSGAIGMSASGGATATNNEAIYVSGSGAVAMYATGGSNIVNAAGARIYLLGGASLAMQVDDETSTIVNGGTIYYSGSLDGTNGLDAPDSSQISNNGTAKADSTTQMPSTDLSPVTVVAAQNSRLITTSSRMFSLAYDTSDIMNSNQMEYRANGVLATSDGNYAGALAPVLFAASYEENNDEEVRESYEQEIENALQVENSLNSQDNTVVVADADISLLSSLSLTDDNSSTATSVDDYKIYDLVLNKRATSEAVGEVQGIQDTSLYEKIDEAYESGKDGQFFNTIKTSMTSEELVNDIKDEFGLAFFNTFAKQNLDVIKSANRRLNSAVFNNNEDKDIRTMIGYDYSARKQDGDAYSGEYEDEAQSVYAMADKKASDSFRYGIGALLTKYSSDYDDSAGSRDEIMVQVLMPLTYSPNKSFKIVSIPRVGMGFGDYKRKADSGTYEDDTKNYYYGITNEARQIVDLGWMAFEPTLEFNVLGLHQDKINENGELEIKASDSISVEGGVGFYATKLFEFGEAHKLKLRAGGTFYHEFGDPFKAQRAHMRNADIYYRLNSYEAGRNRGVVTVRMDYDYNKSLNIYGEFNKFIEDNDAYSINAGMGYRF